MDTDRIAIGDALNELAQAERLLNAAEFLEEKLRTSKAGELLAAALTDVGEAIHRAGLALGRAAA